LQDQGPTWALRPWVSPTHPTPLPSHLSEFFRPSRSSRQLPYHCGCKAKADSRATLPRENLMVPTLLKVGQTGLLARAQKLLYTPALFACPFSLASSRQEERSLASVGVQSSQAPPLSGCQVCPAYSVPLPVGGTLCFRKWSLLWSRWGSQIFLLPRPSPTGSNPKDFRSCAGIVRCARSSAGMR
jgi:hypothetical protein